MNKKQKRNIKVLSGVFVAAAGMIAAAAAHASPVFAHPQSLHNGMFYTDFATFEEEKIKTPEDKIGAMQRAITTSFVSNTR